MNRKRLLAATLTALWPAMLGVVLAQGPVGDEVKVTFDRPVQVGSQTLAAGDYTIKQVSSASNPRVLEFRSHDGAQLDATVTAIPVLQNTPPQETKVVLQDEGGGARLSRIWVQGKTYGYEFPGSATPAAQANTVTAQLSGTYAGAPKQATVATADRSVDTTVATPSTTSSTPIENPGTAATTTAQTVPSPAQQPEETTTPAPAAAPATTPDVPATGLGWVDVVAAGLAMAAAGLVLHKREMRRS